MENLTKYNVMQVAFSAETPVNQRLTCRIQNYRNGHKPLNYVQQSFTESLRDRRIIAAQQSAVSGQKRYLMPKPAALEAPCRSSSKRP